MSEGEIIITARAIAAAQNMTRDESNAYVGRCLRSYREGGKDADELSRLEAALIKGVPGKEERNEKEAIKLTHEFYEWARKQETQDPGMFKPYVVIIWMLERIQSKED